MPILRAGDAEMGKAGWVSALGELAFLVMEGKGTMNKKINRARKETKQEYVLQSAWGWGRRAHLRPKKVTYKLRSE